jgi:hypothetical protein
MHAAEQADQENARQGRRVHWLTRLAYRARVRSRIGIAI